ncbi:MAG: hypothetical protein JO342_07605 [Solirubrobacterales bacterium]|nr:hypothetical protein [Solirubrobacterales bacterium]MBV9166003.1 hypothetical protein [Solirubrobacterales bacterium]
MPDGRERAHVEAALGDQHLGDVDVDARDRARQLDELGVWGEHKLDRRLRFSIAASSVSMCASNGATITP